MMLKVIYSELNILYLSQITCQTCHWLTMRLQDSPDFEMAN